MKNIYDKTEEWLEFSKSVTNIYLKIIEHEQQGDKNSDEYQSLFYILPTAVDIEKTKLTNILTKENYQNILKNKGIIQSMSRKGKCLDNACAENFFSILKSEFFYNREFKSINQFRQELDEYINYYNNSRIKLRLNGKSPIQYRMEYYPNVA